MTLLLRPYRTGDAEAFRTLNEAWIRKYFSIEEKDLTTLGDPETHILASGGHIFFADDAELGKIVGCCALLQLNNNEFELSKMAVEEKSRGRGIGRRLIHFVVDQARALGASRLYLETNDGLVSAVALYRSVGFADLPADRVPSSSYARANVFMELFL